MLQQLDPLLVVSYFGSIFIIVSKSLFYLCFLYFVIVLLLALSGFVFSFGCAGLFIILCAFFNIVWKFCIQVILYNTLCTMVVLKRALIPERSLLCAFCLFISFRLCLMLYLLWP